MKSLYKVVLEKDGGLFSAMGEHLDEVAVKYVVGEWARPSIEGSKLYCFNKLSSAREFIKDFGRLKLRIFRCKAKNHESGTHPMSVIIDPKSVLGFWGKAPKPTFYVGGSRECVWADEILLVKEV